MHGQEHLQVCRLHSCRKEKKGEKNPFSCRPLTHGIVASDSHSTIYGGIGCLGTAIVRSDAASILATSTIFWQVPPIAKVTFTGVLPPGVTGKDVIIALCAFLKSDVLNMCVEFTGSEQTLASISVSERLTISNMACEWGALSGLSVSFPGRDFDE
jgi:homoaconitate hydratase